MARWRQMAHFGMARRRQKHGAPATRLWRASDRILPFLGAPATKFWRTDDSSLAHRQQFKRRDGDIKMAQRRLSHGAQTTRN